MVNFNAHKIAILINSQIFFINKKSVAEITTPSRPSPNTLILKKYNEIISIIEATIETA